MRLKSMLMSVCCVAVMLVGTAVAVEKNAPQPDKDGFYALFDGKTLDGWKVGKNANSFRVEEGLLCANGNVAHLFYDGPVANHDFKNFHFKAEVRTEPNSNSGIYFHTTFQEESWPKKGFECQVNNTFTKDRKKTGGLYSVKDVMDTAPVGDKEWFQYEIIVEGNRVQIKINGKTTTDWTQPEGFGPPKGMEGRKLDHGTIAIQAHDPGSKVCYRNIAIKPLP
jgi:hypothetical protein